MIFYRGHLNHLSRGYQKFCWPFGSSTSSRLNFPPFTCGRSSAVCTSSLSCGSVSSDNAVISFCRLVKLSSLANSAVTGRHAQQFASFEPYSLSCYPLFKPDRDISTNVWHYSILLAAAGGLIIFNLSSKKLLPACEAPADKGAVFNCQDASTSKPLDSTNYHLNHPMWRSEENRPFDRKMEDALIFCGSSNSALANAVADRLGTKLGRVQLRRYADGEVSMQFLDSLRGKDIYIIQSTCPPVQERLVELLFMISTCRRSSAEKITAVIPYYGYARQDRKLSSRVPISAADVARMLECMGVDRVVAVDLHCGQIQGFFGPKVPVDNLEAQVVGLDHFSHMPLHKPVVVSPDAGGVYRARKFQEGLIARGFEQCNIAMLIKQRAAQNQIERMDLVGSVEGSDVIIVDDMIDTAGTLCEAARQLKNHKAHRVFAFATHGLFSGPAIERINQSQLEQVVVTDTVELAHQHEIASPKITVLSVSVLLADAIRRIHQKESLNDLFNLCR